MSFGQLGVIALVFYLIILAVIAEIARRSRSDDSPADHFLAGRQLGAVVLFLTLYATAYSGNSLLGYPGRKERRHRDDTGPHDEDRQENFDQRESVSTGHRIATPE